MEIKYVTKRDGKVVRFDGERIVNAIMAAMKDVGYIDPGVANKIAADIEECSKMMETVESILLNNKPFMKRDDIETLGKDIHDHLIKMFGNNKVLRIEQGDPSIKALLHIVH